MWKPEEGAQETSWPEGAIWLQQNVTRQDLTEQGICLQYVQDTLLSSGQSKGWWDRRAGKLYAMLLAVRQVPHAVNPHLKIWLMLCRAVWRVDALQPVLQRFCLFSLRRWVLDSGLDGAHLKAIMYRTVFLPWPVLAAADSFASEEDQFLVQDNAIYAKRDASAGADIEGAWVGGGQLAQF